MTSTINESRRQTELDMARDGVATRVFLQPIAAPSILGLFGFAGATFIVASNMAGWWGTPTSGLALAPFGTITQAQSSAGGKISARWLGGGVMELVSPSCD